MHQVTSFLRVVITLSTHNSLGSSFSLGIKHDADTTDKSTALSFSTYMIAAGGGSQIKKIGTCTYVKQAVIHNYC